MSLGTRVYSVWEGVRIAFDSIRTNKVRAGLTILGIAVGVFVVTVMSAAVHGINEGVSSSIAAAGPTTFFISKWPAEINNCNGGAESCPWIRNKPLTLAQASQIRNLPTIAGVTAHVNTSTRVKYADRELPNVTVDAYTPEWFDVSGGDINPGRNFTGEEYEAGEPVVLVNDKIVEKLFLGGDAIGKEIRLNGEVFRVIGVYHPIPNAFDPGTSGKLTMPITTAQRKLNASLAWMDLTVKPRDGVSRDDAMDETIALLRSDRHLRPSRANDFFTATPDQILALYNRIVGVFFLVMIVLSAIGLLVGGVGVIAIMMISVTERTREIGVRKALGATRATILWQFLVEAATLTTIGAIVGLAVGGALTLLIRNTTPIQAATPPLAIVAALGCSAFAGIVFGMLPAIRAASLDPVAALRHE
jgi:putative ABC transport system permease protein